MTHIRGLLTERPAGREFPQRLLVPGQRQRKLATVLPPREWRGGCGPATDPVSASSDAFAAPAGPALGQSLAGERVKEDATCLEFGCLYIRDGEVKGNDLELENILMRLKKRGGGCTRKQRGSSG